MREDKVCPLMRAAVIAKYTTGSKSMTYCIGQECAWHDHCYPDNEEEKHDD
jgi:hypothetical protein